ncbi:MAG: serine/threonine protein kinase, partial [Gemmatimonadetes bacterium]|nr:serine/threonine protein kinase [Gemmatimonadota bacterium]
MSRLGAALADRYRIERELGQGGMATVYLAHDLKHDRQVAIKVLRAELGAVLGAERFLAEIKVTANLQHPNLLPLFDSGTTGRRTDGPTDLLPESFFYYVMPYVEGETLRARLERERQLPVDDVVRLVTLMAGALDYAHARGVIHRDLKPENILLQAGQPVIADFGIALAVAQAGGSRITETGLSLGTPHYMSPEQATGDRVIDARSDQYALGAVTYEMLSGEPPHTGPTSQAIIARLMTEAPRSVRATRPAVTPAMDAAIQRALAKPPADRFASCGEFAAALAAGAVTPAEPASPRSTRTRIAGAVALGLLLLGAIGYVLYQ